MNIQKTDRKYAIYYNYNSIGEGDITLKKLKKLKQK